MIQAKLTGDWRHLGQVLSRGAAGSKFVAYQQVKNAGNKLAERIRESLMRQSPGAFPPAHSPWTKYGRLARGSGNRRVLVDTGELAQAITVTPFGADSVIVGVPAGKKNSRGQEFATIVHRHEYGGQILVPVTDALKKYIRGLLARFPELKKELEARNIPSKGMFLQPYIIIDIPKRPFIAPAYSAFLREIADPKAPFWTRYFEFLLGGRPSRSPGYSRPRL